MAVARNKFSRFNIHDQNNDIGVITKANDLSSYINEITDRLPITLNCGREPIFIYPLTTQSQP